MGHQLGIPTCCKSTTTDLEGGAKILTSYSCDNHDILHSPSLSCPNDSSHQEKISHSKALKPNISANLSLFYPKQQQKKFRLAYQFIRVMTDQLFLVQKGLPASVDDRCTLAGITRYGSICAEILSEFTSSLTAGRACWNRARLTSICFR